MDTKRKFNVLRGSTFFRKVPESDLMALAESMHVEKFREGEAVCLAGEPADRVFVVLSGTLEVRRPEGVGRPKSVVEGDLFGEYGLFADETRTADVVCSRDSTLLSLEYARFREFLELFPSTTYALLEHAVLALLSVQGELAARSSPS